MKSNNAKLSLKKKFKFFIYLIITYVFACLIINSHDLFFKSFYANKIWVHRVNSIEKLKEVHTKFSGIELDVVFESKKNAFDVNHPPAKSIHLNLFNYLSAIRLTSDKQFWLDFKNLSANNAIKASNKLDSICSYFELEKNQFIIESTKPEYLNSFTAKGYRTSYYLPPHLNELNDSILTKKIYKIKKINRLHKTTYLSADKRDYVLLKNQFPNRQILTWVFEPSNDFGISPVSLYRKIRLLFLKYKILSDEKVVVALFKYDTKNAER